MTVFWIVASCQHVGAQDKVDSGTDTDSDTDAELDFYGTVTLAFSSFGSETSGADNLALRVAFYDVKPDPEDGFGHVETFTTPGGASCDVFQFPSPAVPPVQVDAGEIRAGLHGGGDYLSVIFEDGAYTTDNRESSDTDNPIPDWAYDSEGGLFFDGMGSPLVPEFSQLADIPPPGHFTNPAPGTEDLYVGVGDTYVINWDQFGGDIAFVVASFEMDWNRTIFECHPAVGEQSVDLPSAQIEEHTGGSTALLGLWIVNEYELEFGGGLVVAEAARVSAKNVHFH